LDWSRVEGSGYSQNAPAYCLPNNMIMIYFATF
jgi:hypothetical protein